RDVSLTASFGVATCAPHESAPELLSRADMALYRSKREGRNRVRVDCGTKVHGSGMQCIMTS
ncbi:MAG TPA: diguanylate cyclase, partial [Acidobacteriaceae bacterium]|nr:diguanylate cyclase [Acidobacteriaceae bacterium]